MMYLKHCLMLAISSFYLLFCSGSLLAQTPKFEHAMNKKQQNMVAIAAYTGKGDLEHLKVALAEGLDAGLTVNEIKEVLVHAYAYCGFPRSLRGLQTFMGVLDERKAKNIHDRMGREASPVTDERSKYDRGKEILSKLTGIPADAPRTGYAAFAPEIEVFLKEHLFADIFERDVLTYQEREITTVSILAAIGGVEPMIRSHMGMCLNIGITPDELRHLLTIVERNIGRDEADSARIVLNELLQEKGLITNPGTPVAELENGVRMQKVTFHNRFQIDVVGDLYLPKDFDTNKKYPAVIVGHPFGGVKEQTSGLHARKLAELGYVTLAFDASHYGESGGYPRRMESPETRVEDFSAAVDFLSIYPSVDGERIGVLGICGGGGYSVSAAQIDHRIKAVATLSMYDMGRARRQGLGDIISYDQRMKTLDEIGEQRTREFGGAERRDIGAIPESVSDRDTENTREFYDYYRTPRGQHPSSTGYYTFTSLAPMMNFFPFAQIETISPRPLLFIVGERAVSAYFSEDAYSKAAEPKELFVVPGASHVDLYDRPEYMKITLPKLDAFYKEYLK